MNDALRLQAQAARRELTAGRLRGAALYDRLLAVPAAEREAFADELLGLPEPPPDIADLPRGAVPYLPAGVDEILHMVREAPLRESDQLLDLGSGLGRVVILAHLLSGAHACGIELQEPLVRCAKDCAAELALTQVAFIHGNAAEAALDGSVFFLYSPFGGETLTRVVRRLEAVARRRPIIVCAVGLELPGEPWLRRRETASRALALYDSCIPAVPQRSPGPDPQQR